VEQPTEEQLEEVRIRHARLMLLLLQLLHIHTASLAGERSEPDGRRRDGEHSDAGAVAESFGAGQREAAHDAVTGMLMLMLVLVLILMLVLKQTVVT
jgi:hypothetical protein